MEEDRWEKAFRGRLEDYSEPVPEQIWENLEADLKTARGGRPVYSFRRIAAAAAVFLAVLSTASLYFLYTPSAEYVKQVRTEIPVSRPSSPVESLSPQPSKLFIAKVKGSVRTYTDTSSEISSPVKEETVTTAQVSAHETGPDKTTTKSADMQEAESPAKGPAENKISSARKKTYRTSYPVSPKRRKDKNWSVGILAGNTPEYSGSSNAGFASMGSKGGSGWYGLNPIGDEEMSESREAYQDMLLRNIDRDAVTSIKHKMPVTVGLSFRYGLNHWLSLETGLAYTFLSSELRTGNEYDFYINRQKLHYVGIPLKVNFKFLDRKYVTLYASTGGMMEKCVSGKLDSDFYIEGKEDKSFKEDLTVKPLQWSLSAAVGAQYNAMEHLGIYVEPGIVYYFDDGSTVETIRKEKPFNFNLQMGVRFTY